MPATIEVQAEEHFFLVYTYDLPFITAALSRHKASPRAQQLLRLTAAARAQFSVANRMIRECGAGIARKLRGGKLRGGKGVDEFAQRHEEHGAVLHVALVETHSDAVKRIRRLGGMFLHGLAPDYRALHPDPAFFLVEAQHDWRAGRHRYGEHNAGAGYRNVADAQKKKKNTNKKQEKKKHNNRL